MGETKHSGAKTTPRIGASKPNTPDDRVFWRYAPVHGPGYYEKQADGTWKEIDKDGVRIQGIWQELSRTTEYVEIWDAVRKYKVRLGAGNAWLAKGMDGEFGPSPHGDWERPGDKRSDKAARYPAGVDADAKPVDPKAAQIAADAATSKREKFTEQDVLAAVIALQNGVRANAVTRLDEAQKKIAAAVARQFPSATARRAEFEETARALDKMCAPLEKLRSIPGDGLPLDAIAAEMAYNFTEMELGAPLDVGRTGRIPKSGASVGTAQVLQVLSSDAVLCSFHKTTFLVRGIPTKGVTDGAIIRLPGVYRVGETETHRLAGGGTRIVAVLQPLDWNTLGRQRARVADTWKADFAGYSARIDRLLAECAKQIQLATPEAEAEIAQEAAAAAAAKKESLAAVKLTFAKSLLQDGNRDKARARLAEIIKEFAGTKAATEAAELLKGI